MRVVIDCKPRPVYFRSEKGVVCDVPAEKVEEWKYAEALMQRIQREMAAAVTAKYEESNVLDVAQD